MTKLQIHALHYKFPRIQKEFFVDKELKEKGKLSKNAQVKLLKNKTCLLELFLKSEKNSIVNLLLGATDGGESL